MARIAPCCSFLLLLLATTCLVKNGDASRGTLQEQQQQQQQQLQEQQVLLQQQAALAAPKANYFMKYYTNSELRQLAVDITAGCGGAASVIKWGVSKEGEELWALELYAGTAPRAARPSFKFVGNVHGDEPSGRQLLLAFADEMCGKFVAGDGDTLSTLQSMSLVLICTANPDGFVKTSRENSGHLDLNRNYPDPWKHSGVDLKQPLGKEQPETLAMMNFTLSRRFIGSLALHEGALVANYPFDGYTDGNGQIRKQKHATPDDATFVHLAKTYARLHTTMAINNQEFPEGITNGAQWYPVYGGMQDWNYLAAGCLEITLELNERKWPDLRRLEQMWEENRVVFARFPREVVLGGVRGMVAWVPAKGDKGKGAKVSIVGQGYSVMAPAGVWDFYRPLAPGDYDVLIEVPGQAAVTRQVHVPADGTGVSIEVDLRPPGSGPITATPAPGATEGIVGGGGAAAQGVPSGSSGAAVAVDGKPAGGASSPAATAAQGEAPGGGGVQLPGGAVPPQPSFALLAGLAAGSMALLGAAALAWRSIGGVGGGGGGRGGGYQLSRLMEQVPRAARRYLGLTQASPRVVGMGGAAGV